MLFGKRQPLPQQISNLQKHAITVEQILASIGVDLARARRDTEHGSDWSFQRGSDILEVYIAEQRGRAYLQVLAPLMHLPAGGLLPLYRRLLELNLSLTNASLGIYLDVIYVFNE